MTTNIENNQEIINTPTQSEVAQSNNKSVELTRFTIKQLLEAGVHFGHKTMRRNPKMSKYIFENRNGVSIIDLNKTAIELYKAMLTVKEIVKNNGKILFISTKKQGAEPVASAAKRCGQYYVNFRWLGGMLTNWKTVSQSIKTFKKIEEELNNKDSDLNKKEKLMLERKRQKFESIIGGVKNIGGYPDLIFVIDTNKESLAIDEAKKLGVPVMAIVDTNCNPDGIDFVIPGNDDSAKAIRLYCKLISDAAIAGLKESVVASGLDLNKFDDQSLEEIKEQVSNKVNDAKKANPKAGNKDQKDIKIVRKDTKKPAVSAKKPKTSKEPREKKDNAELAKNSKE